MVTTNGHDQGHAAAVDPVRVAVVQARLDHLCRRMGWVMTRTARSPIFSQSHDFSCFATDRDGVLVSTADGIPIHTGGGGFAVRAILDGHGSDLADGDVFLLNDPYTAGGNHLPDWVIARPVFVDSTLVAFCCNRAHQSDIGGGAAGTYNPEATEIYHEGLRLPVLRLVEGGAVREDLWELLLLNSRTPDLLDGDLRAMLGSTAIGPVRWRSWWPISRPGATRRPAPSTRRSTRRWPPSGRCAITPRPGSATGSLRCPTAPGPPPSTGTTTASARPTSRSGWP